MQTIDPKKQREIMDFVGKIFARNFDVVVEEWSETFTKEDSLKPKKAKMHRFFQQLTPENQSLVMSMIRATAITAYTYFLLEAQQFDAGQDGIGLTARYEAEVYPDLAEISDGLGGEIMQEDGWLGRFSKYYHPEDEEW